MKTAIELCKEAGASIGVKHILDCAGDGVFMTPEELNTLLAIHKEEVLDEIRAQGVRHWLDTPYGEVQCQKVYGGVQFTQHVNSIPLYTLPEKGKAK